MNQPERGIRDMGRSRESVPLAEAISEYVAAVIVNANAIDEGNSRAANKAYRRTTVARERMSGLGAVGETAFRALLNHENARVRAAVAVELLATMPEKAVPVLEEIARLPGTAGLGAELTLADWRRRGIGRGE